MAIIMDGKKLAAKIKEELKSRIDEMEQKPILHVVQVGNDPASNTYIHNKQKACEDVGIIFTHIAVDPHVPQHWLEYIVGAHNVPTILQLPIPKTLDADRAIKRINAVDDVDGLRSLSVFTPCTPKGIMHLLKEYYVPLEGKHAVVVGRSDIVGKPVAKLLLNENCTVTVCHSKTKNLAEYTRQADILVSAVGKPHLITADMVKPGVAVIDVGINRVDGKLVGDVDFENVEKIAGWITPVPGGVGPMTVAMLLENVVESAEKRRTVNIWEEF